MLPLSPSCFGTLDTPNLINLPLPDMEMTSHEELAELQLHTGNTPHQPSLLQVAPIKTSTPVRAYPFIALERLAGLAGASPTFT